MPICQVCSQSFKNLTSHINAKHNLNKKEYINFYPDAKIIDDDLSDKFSLRSKRMHEELKLNDPDAYQKIRNQTCQTMRNKKGKLFRHTAETKKKMSLSHKGKIKGPHSTATKEKLSKSKIGKPINLTDESKKIKTDKQKEKWRTRKENTEEFAAYISQLSLRRKEYILSNDMSVPKKGKKTSLEKRFESFLVENKIEYCFQYFLNGKYYDFFLPSLNLLVEVDGEYWHRLPAAIKNDIEKHIIAKESGNKILRLTEKWWKTELIFEVDYTITQQHNFEILNKRTLECQNYELSISMI